MTFASGFYSFNLTINDTARQVYETKRVKLARHPEESLQELYARVLSYVHCYEQGLEFTPGPFEQKLPTLIKQDIFGEIELWVQIGCPSFDKVRKAIRNNHNAAFGIYFLNEKEIERFCGYLRGSKSNWVAAVDFYLLQPEFLLELSSIDKSSSSWTMTIVDNNLYLVFDGREFQTTIQKVDIWERFQESLRESV